MVAPWPQVEAFASKLTLLACVSEANFARLLQVDEAVQRSLCAEAKRRLLFSYRSARIPFFCEMSDASLAKFAELSSLVPVDAGETIEVLADEARGLYVIADGSVEATVSGSNSSHADKWSLSYGHYFGELGLILPESGSLDVQYRAGAEEVTLLMLPLAAFAALFGKDRSLMAELRMKVRATAPHRATAVTQATPYPSPKATPEAIAGFRRRARRAPLE